MTYVLETITPEDQEKILRDAECDERKKKILIRRGYFNKDEPPRDWVIERDKNSYLFWAPRPPMDQSYYYYFYFNNFLYALRINSISNCIVYFDDKPFFPPPDLAEFKQAIIDAFSVFGVGGLHSVVTFEQEV